MDRRSFWSEREMETRRRLGARPPPICSHPRPRPLRRLICRGTGTTTVCSSLRCREVSSAWCFPPYAPPSLMVPSSPVPRAMESLSPGGQAIYLQGLYGLWEGGKW